MLRLAGCQAAFGAQQAVREFAVCSDRTAIDGPAIESVRVLACSALVVCAAVGVAKGRECLMLLALQGHGEAPQSQAVAKADDLHSRSVGGVPSVSMSGDGGVACHATRCAGLLGAW